VDPGRLPRCSSRPTALISLLQFLLGAVLAGTGAPGTAHLLYGAVNRLDAVNMLALAVLAVAAATSGTTAPAAAVRRNRARYRRPVSRPAR
jgi:hypothetical protein